MEFTTYQNFERRNAQDQITRPGTWGKNTALVNAQNTGILDYIANNLDWLKINKAEADDVEALQDEKVDKTTTVNGHALSGNVTITKGDVGLANVDNIKQVAYAQGTANAGKVFYVNSSGNFDILPGYKLKDNVLCVEVAD